MNIALVRLPYSDVYGVYHDPPERREIRPPLGLLYVAAALERGGHNVIVYDLEAYPEATFHACLWDMVGVTATTPEFRRAETFLWQAKQENPDIVTVIGGPHASALPVESLRPWIDHVVVGEGEWAMRVIARGGMPRIVQEPDEEEVDSLPLPARHLVNPAWYNYPHPKRGMVQMDVVLSARGCPFKCGFCFNRARPPRYRRIGRVAGEVAMLKARGAELVMFLDDTLSLKPSRLMDLCKELEPLGLSFFGSVRADTVSYPLLKAMRRAGFVEVTMGVESGVQALLNGTDKGTTLDQYRLAYRWMKDLGIQTRGSFVLGLPGETHETAAKTLAFAKSLPLDRAACNILTPYPGTEMWDRARRGDGLRLLTDDFDKFKRWGTAVVETDGLTGPELEAWQRRFLAEFYTQPGVLAHHARRWLGGNRSRYYHRPVAWAMKERVRGPSRAR